MASPGPPLGSPAQYTTQQLPGAVYENLNQDIIHITADKAHRYLSEWRQKIEAQSSWVAPLSLGASLLLALLTADFKDRFGVPKEYWSALFFVGFLATMVWLIRSLKRRIFNAPESTDQIVDKFKNTAPASV
jgi:hypothetical protein